MQKFEEKLTLFKLTDEHLPYFMEADEIQLVYIHNEPLEEPNGLGKARTQSLIQASFVYEDPLFVPQSGLAVGTALIPVKRYTWSELKDLVSILLKLDDVTSIKLTKQQ